MEFLEAKTTGLHKKDSTITITEGTVRKVNMIKETVQLLGTKCVPYVMS